MAGGETAYETPVTTPVAEAQVGPSPTLSHEITQRGKAELINEKDSLKAELSETSELVNEITAALPQLQNQLGRIKHRLDQLERAEDQHDDPEKRGGGIAEGLKVMEERAAQAQQPEAVQPREDDEFWTALEAKGHSAEVLGLMPKDILKRIAAGERAPNERDFSPRSEEQTESALKHSAAFLEAARELATASEETVELESLSKAFEMGQKHWADSHSSKTMGFIMRKKEIQGYPGAMDYTIYNTASASLEVLSQELAGKTPPQQLSEAHIVALFGGITEATQDTSVTDSTVGDAVFQALMTQNLGHKPGDLIQGRQIGKLYGDLRSGMLSEKQYTAWLSTKSALDKVRSTLRSKRVRGNMDSAISRFGNGQMRVKQAR